MVAWFNKWLLALALPVIGISTPGKPLISGDDHTHPLHLSVTEIEHNSTDKTLEISCKLFTDDFENILEKNYRTEVDLINAPNRAAIQKLVNDYVQKHLVIRLDGKQVGFNCIGFERDHEATWAYFQADNVVSVKKVELNNTLMYDLFDDQTNIMHIIVGGSRKSTKLNYPGKEVSVGF